MGVKPSRGAVINMPYIQTPKNTYNVLTSLQSVLWHLVAVGMNTSDIVSSKENSTLKLQKQQLCSPSKSTARKVSSHTFSKVFLTKEESCVWHIGFRRTAKNCFVTTR